MKIETLIARIDLSYCLINYSIKEMGPVVPELFGIKWLNHQ
jgi:hypothetical protein